MVSDGDSLTPVAPAASGSEPVFNDVYVPPVPVTVSAGDNLSIWAFISYRKKTVNDRATSTYRVPEYG